MDRAQRLVADTCSDMPEAKRLIGCGRTIRSKCGVVVQRAPDGTTFVSGVATCGSVWSCPSCSFKIRIKRAADIAVACAVQLSNGGGVLFATFTMSHMKGESLDLVWSIITDGWSYLTSGGGWQSIKERFGIEGWIRSAEVTHGGSGWHPHLHVLIFTSKPLDPLNAEDEQFWDLRKALRQRWIHRLDKKWERDVSQTFGFDLVPVKPDETSTVGEYVSKVGYELAVADSKLGRGEGQRHPFAIARDASQTGDTADIKLFREWITASKGRRAITWSQGLRDRLLSTDERTDEELASEIAEGENVAGVEPTLWNQILARRDGAKAQLLMTLEVATVGVAADLLEVLGLPVEIDRTGVVPWLRLRPDKQVNYERKQQ